MQLDYITSGMTPRLIAVEIVILSAQAILYFGCEIFQHDHKDVKRSIDDRIPLIPAAAFAYVSWFPLIALFPIVLYHLSPFEYAVYQMSIILSDLASTAIYLAYPTTFERPALSDHGGSFAEKLLRVIYRGDFKGSNCSPSLHCIQSFIIMMAAFCCPALHGAVGALVICICLAIVAATLLTKQHVLTDVVTAMPAAVMAYAAGRLIAGFAGYEQLLSFAGLL